MTLLVMSEKSRYRESGKSVAAPVLIETITHLAFYAGRPNSMTAVMAAKKVFESSAQ